jgi:hypothetical protein
MICVPKDSGGLGKSQWDVMGVLRALNKIDTSVKIEFLVHIDEEREGKHFMRTKRASTVSNSLETRQHPH